MDRAARRINREGLTSLEGLQRGVVPSTATTAAGESEKLATQRAAAERVKDTTKSYERNILDTGRS